MIQETCPTNQWVATAMRVAIKEHALAEQAVQNSRGHVEPFDTYLADIEMKWLDAAIPAGNA